MIWPLAPFANLESAWSRHIKELSSFSAGIATGLLTVLVIDGRLILWLGLTPDLMGTAAALAAWFLAQGAVLWVAFTVGLSGFDHRTATRTDVAAQIRPVLRAVVDRWLLGTCLVLVLWSGWNLAASEFRQGFPLITLLAFSFISILSLEPISRRIWHLPAPH